MSISSTCKISGCTELGTLDRNGKRYLTLGLCGKHYARYRSTGDPLKTRFRVPKNYLRGGVGYIELTRGRVALCSPQDFARLSEYLWDFMKTGYAGTHSEGRRIKMHKLVVPYPHTDHINRDKLDNRRENLREATQQQNMYNQGIKTNNTTGYKGVYFNKRRGNYDAYIKSDKKRKYLGAFKTAKEAALAYNRAAPIYHGEFASLNEV